MDEEIPRDNRGRPGARGRSRLDDMKKSDNYVTLTAVGDVMLGWGVEERIKGGSDGYPFELVAPTLRNSDITFLQSRSLADHRVKKGNLGLHEDS